MNRLLFLFLCFLFFVIAHAPKVALSQTANHEINEAVIDSITDAAYLAIREDPLLALELSGQALKLSRELSYADGEINALLLTGMVYKNTGAFVKSAESYFEALKIAELHNNQPKISSCLNNIGNVYQSQGNYEKALHYYNLSLEIEESLDNKSQISIRLYNIGVLYESMDSLHKALTYYYNSLLTEEQLNNDEGIFYALYGIAGIEIRLERFESASENLKRAMSIANRMNDRSASALCYHETGKLYLAMKEFEMALVHLDSGITIAEEIQMNLQLTDIYLDKAFALNYSGNHKDAFTFLHKYVTLKDSINNIEIAGKIAEMETLFQFEKQENEIAFLKNLTEIKNQKAISERRNKNFLLITVFLVIILFVFNLNRIAPNIKSVLLLILIAIIGIVIVSLILFYWTNFGKSESLIAITRDVFTYSVPLMFAGLFIAERILMKRYFQKAKDYTRELQTLSAEIKNATIDLQFEGKDATLSIALENLLCIEANDNYVKTYFLSEGKVKSDLFRSTMKMAENQLSQYEEIIRCHKSYIINTMNIELISGNAQGYKIQLKYLDFEIPVSRNFPGNLISKLKNPNKHT